MAIAPAKVEIMPELTVEINTKNLEIALRCFPKELKYEIADGMDHISKRFLVRFRQTRLQGPPGVKGRPHGIFTYFKRVCLVSQDIEGMGMVIYSESKITRMHEEGAVITNPGGRKLAVPLSKRTEMFKGGEYPGRLKARYKEPSLIKGIKPILLNGKWYLARVLKKLRTPLFILKGQIRIKPRLGFYGTWDSMQNDRIEILNKSIDKALKTI